MLSSFDFGRNQGRNFCQQFSGALIVGLFGRHPFLIPVKAAREVREEAINSDPIDPEIVLHVRVLVKISVQKLVLVPVRVWVNLHRHNSQVYAAARKN